MGIPAAYFDGKTSRLHAVTLTVANGIASIDGDAERRCPIAALRVLERSTAGQRKVTFPDGAYLEVQDAAAFNMLLTETGHRDSFVVRMQQSWRGALMACAATVMALILIYFYALPAASSIAARTIPDSVTRDIGREALTMLDERLLSPSRLPAQRRKQIVDRFNALTPAADNSPRHEILFRKSRIGPNALALPSGQIVLTDEIVMLADSDDALMGVLAHELGHLHERHLMRRLLQSTAIAAGAFAIFGDVSAIAANFPAVLLDLKYSRDAEIEADAYAVAMLRKNGIAASAMADLLETMESQSGSEFPPYASSHPPTVERIERLRN